MLFEEIIAVYSKKHKKPINTKCRITDYYSRWDIWLPLGFKGLIIDPAVILFSFCVAYSYFSHAVLLVYFPHIYGQKSYSVQRTV
jgi:hypothetical protein